MKHIILSVLAIVIGSGIFAWAVTFGADQQARVDCKELQKQTALYPAYDYQRHTGFYITEWQKQMCDSVHISVTAAVLR